MQARPKAPQRGHVARVILARSGPQPAEHVNHACQPVIHSCSPKELSVEDRRDFSTAHGRTGPTQI